MAREVIELFDSRLPERFWNKISPEPNSGCWLWVGNADKDGYGEFKLANGAANGKQMRAFRYAYEVLFGELGELQADHKCRTTCCVNISHAEPVTALENVRRSNPGKRQLARNKCPYGHPYNEENTYIWFGRDGGRHRACRECRRIRNALSRV